MTWTEPAWSGRDSNERSGRPGDVAWQAAYRQYGSALLAFLRRRVRRTEEAEDLLQETFVRALRADRGEMRPEGMKSYLFTIAGNLAIDRSRRQRPVLLSEIGAADAEPFAETADAGERPIDEAVGDRLRLAAIGRAVAELPDHYRAAFSLAVVEKRSYREVAELLGWSLEQVKINVHRARRKVLAALAVAEARRPSTEEPS